MYEKDNRSMIIFIKCMNVHNVHINEKKKKRKKNDLNCNKNYLCNISMVYSNL